MALGTFTETDIAEILRHMVVDDITLDPAEDTLLASVLAIKTYIDDQDTAFAQDLFESVASDSGTAVADNTTDTLSILGGVGISTSVSVDVLTVTNDSPNVVQDLWDVVAGDSGSTTANSATDTLTIAGGTSITTAVSGDTVTITNDAPNVDQNLFLNVASDSGTAVADNTTDTLSILGGTGISTAVSADAVTITNTSPASANEVTSSANITDHSIVRGDGGAKGVQDSGVIIDDTDNVSAIADLDMTGDLTVDGDVVVGAAGPAGNTLSTFGAGAILTIISSSPTSSIVRIGSGAIKGALVLSGHATGEVQGGLVQFLTSDDHDTTIQEFVIGATSDDFVLGPDTDPDSLIYAGGTGIWTFTGAAGAAVTNDLAVGGDLTVTGDVLINADTDGGDLIVGRGRMGFVSGGNTDDFYLAHVDEFNTTDYAMRILNGGALILNAPSTKSVTLAIAGSSIVRVNATEMRPHVDGVTELGTTVKRWQELWTDNVTVTNDVDIDGVIFLKERADAKADVEAYGQIWINTATPNELWFTDDAGTDHQIAFV